VSGESNHIDEIIRQKFEAFEPAPPPGVWDKIKKALDIKGSPGSKGPVVFTILTLTSLIITLFFIFTNLNNIPSGNPETEKNLSKDYSWSEPFIDNYSGVDATYSDAVPSSEINTFYDFENYYPLDKGSGTNDDPPPVSSISMKAKKRVNKAKAFERFTENNNITGSSKQIRKSIEGAPVLNGSFITITSEQESSLFKRQHVIRPAQDYHREKDHYLSFGFDFVPEATMYPGDRLNLSGQSYMLGVTYGISNLYIKSGIGLRNVKDIGDYSLQYNKYLGNYEHVYEVTFDSTDQGIMPTYHTFTVDVYDSIDHVTIGQQTVRNTYLEIPILFGYRKELGKLSFHIHAGPNISVLTGRESLPTNYPEEQIRIVKSQQSLSSRMKINWQIMAGAGIDYQLTNRLNLTIEPVFRYYLSPEFKDTGSTGNGFGFGLRTGISYSISK
jgi:hypothetical protein